MGLYVLALGCTLFTMMGAGFTYLETSHDAREAAPDVTTITLSESPSAPTPSPSETLPPESATTPPPSSPSPTKDKITTIEDEITRMVNAERAGKCDPMRTDERLRKAARAHSADMAAKNYFSHNGQDGSSFVDRVARAGYPRERAAAENIAMGYATAKAVMKGWMESAGHKANILNCKHREIGVGLAYRGNTPYWTQNFGRS